MIYARQINPDIQESPLMLDDYGYAYDDFIVDGNTSFNSHTTEEYDTVKRCMYDAAYDVHSIVDDVGDSPYTSLRECIEDYFNPNDFHGGPYTDADIDNIRDALEAVDDDSISRPQTIALILSALTGRSYETCTIRGWSQRDWQTVFFDVDTVTPEALHDFEAEYFNIGTEWVVEQMDYDPADPAGIDGETIYCHYIMEDEICAEIAATFGCSPEDVVLYEYGERVIPVYTRIH